MLTRAAALSETQFLHFLSKYNTNITVPCRRAFPFMFMYLFGSNLGERIKRVTHICRIVSCFSRALFSLHSLPSICNVAVSHPRRILAHTARQYLIKHVCSALHIRRCHSARAWCICACLSDISIIQVDVPLRYNWRPDNLFNSVGAAFVILKLASPNRVFSRTLALSRVLPLTALQRLLASLLCAYESACLWPEKYCPWFMFRFWQNTLEISYVGWLESCLAQRYFHIANRRLPLFALLYQLVDLFTGAFCCLQRWRQRCQMCDTCQKYSLSLFFTSTIIVIEARYFRV